MYALRSGRCDAQIYSDNALTVALSPSFSTGILKIFSMKVAMLFIDAPPPVKIIFSGLY